MKEVDCIVQSFDIQGDEITIEKKADGSEHVLGHGSFGQVRAGFLLMLTSADADCCCCCCCCPAALPDQVSRFSLSFLAPAPSVACRDSPPAHLPERRLHGQGC